MNTIRRIILGIYISAGALVLASCGPQNTPEAESTEESETVLAIEQDDISETEPVIRMEIDGEILPVLADVTTAEDNSVLAPVYLQRGDKHPIVMRLQERLMDLGYMDNDEPTTYFGDATAESIRKFQRQLKLAQDGICGMETWDLLFSGDAPYYKVMKGDQGDDIRQLFLREPAASGKFGLDERNHRIASADGEGANLGENRENLPQGYFLFHSGTKIRKNVAKKFVGLEKVCTFAVPFETGSRSLTILKD